MIKGAVVSGMVNVTLHSISGISVRWMMGEDATAFGGAIRDMWQPLCMGDPDTANHDFQICSPNDNGGVHSGSGVPNHAFAMLTDGKRSTAIRSTRSVCLRPPRFGIKL